MLALQASLVEALADITETEVVDQGVGERSCVSYGERLAGIHLLTIGRIPRELRTAIPSKRSRIRAEGRAVAVEYAPEENAVIPVRGDVVIQFGDVSIELPRQRGRECKAAIVERVAY